MDEFHINFDIFGKYGDFNSRQKAELSSPVKKRKREESSEEGNAEQCRFGELYFSAEKHYERWQINCKTTHCVKFLFVLQVTVTIIPY